MILRAPAEARAPLGRALFALSPYPYQFLSPRPCLVPSARQFLSPRFSAFRAGSDHLRRVSISRCPVLGLMNVGCMPSESERRTRGRSLPRSRMTSQFLSWSIFWVTSLARTRTSSSMPTCGMAKRLPPVETMSDEIMAKVSGNFMVMVVLFAA